MIFRRTPSYSMFHGTFDLGFSVTLLLALRCLEPQSELYGLNNWDNLAETCCVLMNKDDSVIYLHRKVI